MGSRLEFYQDRPTPIRPLNQGRWLEVKIPSVWVLFDETKASRSLEGSVVTIASIRADISAIADLDQKQANTRDLDRDMFLARCHTLSRGMPKLLERGEFRKIVMN